ncbi:MAG: DUF3276 family protein [Bacteroidaceae bacterium]|nr:DUF3276 family protein [Bacteroidaceae bacterium]
MEDYQKKSTSDIKDREIMFSKSIKAGKRIYYLDVKKNRKEELFLAITESKKVVIGEGDNAQVNFEKHKIFLYKEDFEKFSEGLKEAVDYIENEQGHFERKRMNNYLLDTMEKETPSIVLPNEEIKIDIDF